MLKNFSKETTPMFQDVLHADGSKTYDTVYGMITIKRKFVVDEIEKFILGETRKLRFSHLLSSDEITQDEYDKIIRIID
jgi:hypothetical protein